MSQPQPRPGRPADLAACIDLLAEVHAADGYPVRRPPDPGRWLTPAGLLGAWVTVRGSCVLGHVGLVEAYLGAARATRRGGQRPRGGPAGSRVPAVRRTGRPWRRPGTGAARRGRCGRGARGHRLVLEVADDAHAARKLNERLGWQRVTSGRAKWLAADGQPALVHHYLTL